MIQLSFFVFNETFLHDTSKNRPKEKWLETIENDIRAVGLCVKDVKN